MKRYFSLTLVLWLGFSGLVSASVGLGNAQAVPESFAAPRIGICNNAPCVQDVVPGLTSWDDVMNRFALVPESSTSGNSLILGANALVQTTFTSDEQQARVDSITVSFAVPYLTLGMLFAQYGIPCKLRSYASGGVQVIYPKLTANLDVTDDSSQTRFSSDVEIKQLNYSAEPNSCDQEIADPPNLYHDEEWHGFTQLQN